MTSSAQHAEQNAADNQFGDSCAHAAAKPHTMKQHAVKRVENY
jgi:hypothetical protein